MAKAGDEYQEIVAAVVQAMDPGAQVKTGQWVMGPDGQRDIDVEVRGTVDGMERFVLVECKDHKRPIGIGYIDALDSKRHDLGADETVIYGNAGFTKEALAKASRVGIGAASALKEGNGHIRFVLYRQVAARRKSLKAWRIHLHLSEENKESMPRQWVPDDMSFAGLPFTNWLSEQTRSVVTALEDDAEVRATYRFRHSTPFTISGRAVMLNGVAIFMLCTCRWVTQTARVDVTLGMYDHLRDSIAIPPKQTATFDFEDKDAWEELPGPPKLRDVIQLGDEITDFTLTVRDFPPLVEGAGTPPIDDVVVARIVQQLPWPEGCEQYRTAYASL
jgi:hypothetical protein